MEGKEKYTRRGKGGRRGREGEEKEGKGERTRREGVAEMSLARAQRSTEGAAPENPPRQLVAHGVAIQVAFLNVHGRKESRRAKAMSEEASPCRFRRVER